VSQVEHFDRIAGRYDELRAPPGVTALHKTLVREADLVGKRVLDIGCGTGADLRVLAESFGCRVAGVDSSEGMLAEARRKVRDAELRLGVAERLPFDDGRFDAALMSLVVHHLDRPRAFAEARRVRAAGGRLVIVTPDFESFPRAWMAPLFPSYVEVEQARFPSRHALEEELETAGFASVKMPVVPIPIRSSTSSNCSWSSLQRRRSRELGGPFGGEDGEVAVPPDDARREARGIQPGELILRPVGQVEPRRQRRNGVARSIGDDDVPEDEAAAGPQRSGDAAEQVDLAGAVEVVDRERRHDEVERPAWKRLLEP
jgi:SAM-dependent methyltransferase